jgi:hypothetical protein
VWKSCGFGGFHIYEYAFNAQSLTQWDFPASAYARIKPTPITTTLIASTSAPAYKGQIHPFGFERPAPDAMSRGVLLSSG